jgi:hypothetical protein
MIVPDKVRIKSPLMKLLQKSFAFYAVALGFPILFASMVWADENPGDYLHTRTYIGGVGTSISVNKSGEFTGTNYSHVNNPYDIVLIPSIAQNFGFGLLIGHREETYAMEVSYWRSEHVATFGPAIVETGSDPVTFSTAFQDTASYQSINLDFKKYFLSELDIQPFLNLGVSFPWITVPFADGDSSGNVGPATLAGLGLNVGVGVEYYLTPNISFIGGVYQRWASFDQFRGRSGQYGVLDQYGTDTSNEGSGLNFAVGTTFGFQ